MINRRQILAALAATPMLAAPVLAQPRWAPSRSMHLVVPFPAGGSPDVLTRLMAPHAQAAIGQSALVENRTGTAATPDHIAARLMEVANDALRQPDVQARGAQAGFLLRGTDVAAESEKWGRIIRERNITFDG